MQHIAFHTGVLLVCVPLFAQANLGEPSAFSSVSGDVFLSSSDSEGSSKSREFEVQTSNLGELRVVEGEIGGYGYYAAAFAEPGVVHAKAISSLGGTMLAAGLTSSAEASYTDWMLITGGSGSAEASLTASLSGTLGGEGFQSLAGALFEVSYIVEPPPECTVSASCDDSNFSRTLISDTQSIGFGTNPAQPVNINYESTFTFTYDLPFQLSIYLEAFAIQGGYADFFDSGKLLTLNLPDGARFTSASGLLFPAAVPEPQTYALFAAGLGLVGAMVSRRRRLG